MKLPKFQIHLASKAVIPGKPAMPAKDGHSATPATEARTIPIAGMSNRAVRYQQLDALKVDKIEADAAKMAGADATLGEMRQLAWLHGVCSMVYEVSDPTDDASKLDPKKGWHKVTFQDLILDPTGKMKASDVFTSKDLDLLTQEYRKLHEMNQAEFEALTQGKAQLIPEDSEG